jgi:hypothetical protein
MVCHRPEPDHAETHVMSVTGMRSLYFGINFSIT